METVQTVQALAPTRFRKSLNNKVKGALWSAEEDALLKDLMNRGSTTWSEMVPHFPGKTASQIAERWDKVLNPSLVKGSWTREEDEAIIAFVSQYGTKNWTKLSHNLPGRIGKQCRERWINHLDPNVNRSPFTPEEDALLLELHEQYGGQWVKIAEYMPGRTDNAIKNRWNSTLKKRFADGESTPKPRRQRRNPAPKSADCAIPKPPTFDEILPPTSRTPDAGPGLTPNILQSPCLFGLRSPFTPLLTPGSNQPDFNTSMWSPEMGGNGSDLKMLSPIFSPQRSNDRIETLLFPKI